MINAFDERGANVPDDARPSGDTMSDTYQFHVEGHLDHTWSAWLGDVLIQQQHDGTTLLIQTIPDQSALYGVLFRLSNIGVSLIAVQRISDSTGADHMTHDQAADEAAIREVITAVEAAWNAGDGSGFAAPFAEDADYVIVDGRYIKGRQVIAQGHQGLFESVYRGSHNVATVRGIRHIRDDVAVAHVEWRLAFQQGGEMRKSQSITTMVMLKANGIWSIAAFQNTPVVSP